MTMRHSTLFRLIPGVMLLAACSAGEPSRTALMVGLGASILGATFGSLIGVASAYFGGRAIGRTRLDLPEVSVSAGVVRHAGCSVLVVKTT